MLKMESSAEDEFSIYKDLMAKLLLLEKNTLEYGYYAEQWHTEANWDMASLALTMERGSVKHNIPSRPFMRQSGMYFMSKGLNIVKLAYQDFITGRSNAQQMLGRVGVAAKKNVSNTITFQNFVALKPSTIAKKGFDTILIETGTLENALTIKIK